MNDLISRQAAIDALFELYEYQRDIDPTEAADLVRQGIYLAEKKIEQLPSVQPEKRTEKRTETHACDCISREAAIDAICAVCGNDCDKSEFVYNAPQDEQVILCPEHYCLCNLPSAQPERKTGRWEKAETDWKPKEWVPWLCSECGYRVGRSRTRFCPNCGSLMLKEGEG